MKKKTRCVLIFNSFDDGGTSYMPVEVDDVFAIRMKLDSFNLEFSKGWRIGYIDIFNRSWSSLELRNYELLTIDEWFNSYK